MYSIIFEILTHFLVFIVGFVLGSIYAKNKKVTQNIVSLVIIILWSYSVFIDIHNGGSNTPTFLHLFMGAVVGAVNSDFGNFLIKLIKK